MDAKEFVASWKREKEYLLETFIDPSGESMIAQKIRNLNLTYDQNKLMKEIVNDILTDTFYTLLLGLDGEANIGDVQTAFKIHDENGNVISSVGEIEAEAWEQFHEEKK